MHIPHSFDSSSPRRPQAHALAAAGLLLLSAVTCLAQSSGGSGSSGGSSGGGSDSSSGSATTGGSQADRDVEAARRAGSSGTGNNNGAGVGASGTGASGTGASGTGMGAGRPRDEAADAVERSRARNLPGAAPGDAPAQRAGGAATPGSTSSATDLDPPVGGSAASRPGSSLGGLPSDGVATDGSAMNGANNANDTNDAQRDSRTTARMIGETSFVYRDRAMTLAERELTAGNSLSSSILRGSTNLSGAARTRVDDSVAEANAARTELSKAISRARSANEDRWESSRSDVVDRYEDYVKALEKAREAATEGGVRLQDAAGTSATTPAPR